MAGIRAIVFAGLGTSVFMFFLILAVGGFGASNGARLPANLTNQYNVYSSNNIYGSNSAISGVSPLLAKTSADKNLTQNQSFIGGTTSAVAISVGLIPSIISLWSNYINFVGAGLEILNINTAYAQQVALASIIILVILTIVSALWLFPI